jgi:inner membrane protein involved in colicin E2 resistance
VAVERTPFVVPSEANECWAMDFMSDVLSTGRRYRIFGALLLFAALAILMVMTRRVDWYRLSEESPTTR